MSQRMLFTIGHSTRAWVEFVALLRAWEIKEVVDVRTVPRSRMFPWFSKERMEKALPKSAIEYVHLSKLGGFRNSPKRSLNTGWKNLRFRAYADYMQTTDFEDGLKELNQAPEEAASVRDVFGGSVVALPSSDDRRCGSRTRDPSETRDDRKGGKAACDDRVCAGGEENRWNASNHLSKPGS